MTNYSKQYVRTLLELCDKSLTKEHRVYEMLVKQGKVFDNPVEAPVELMDTGNCFDNAYEYAVKYKLKYCEGYACDGMPKEHAWCIKRGKMVVDPTRGVAGSDYLGYIVDLDSVSRLRMATGMPGVFCQSWETIREFVRLEKRWAKPVRLSPAEIRRAS
jgi:hypothetical protein